MKGRTDGHHVEKGSAPEGWVVRDAALKVLVVARTERTLKIMPLLTVDHMQPINQQAPTNSAKQAFVRGVWRQGAKPFRHLLRVRRQTAAKALGPAAKAPQRPPVNSARTDG